MIRIFAKHKTDEKAVVYCLQNQVRDVQLMLNSKYGGSWLLVDKINPTHEILRFNDGLEYNGFHGRDERYCNAIDKVVL